MRLCHILRYISFYRAIIYCERKVSYSNPNKQKDKFGALVSTWLRCRPRWAPAHRRPPPCPALTIIASFCLPDYLDCYNEKNQANADGHCAASGRADGRSLFSGGGIDSRCGRAWFCRCRFHAGLYSRKIAGIQQSYSFAFSMICPILLITCA